MSPGEVDGSVAAADVAEPAISTQDLVVRFGRVRALDGLSLVVPSGAKFGLVGNNGAGKTTAIHALLGLIPATSGRARVLGQDPARAGHAIRKWTGFFPERDQPYAWMRLRTLWAMAARAYPSWDAALATDLAHRFDLDPRRRVQQLSKGMVAKAKLVVALAHRPELLVLDEPTSGLDPGSRYELLDVIRTLDARRHTALISSHNLDELETLATHIGLVHHGRCVLSESVAAIHERYGLLRTTVTNISVSGTDEPAVAQCEQHLSGQALSRLDEDGTTGWLVRDRHADGVAGLVHALGDRLQLETPTLPQVFHWMTKGRLAASGRAKGEQS
ncbi:MAG: ABC transporter ATP-binding protein [Planctomycetota bacterium]